MNSYRAWDRTNNRMLYDGIALAMSDLGKYVPTDKTLGELPDIVLLQFTGLHDKHNVKIYHGDIVRIAYDPLHSREVFLRVEWADGQIEGLAALGWWFMEMGANADHKQSAPASSVYSEGVEIVGNIYENHEFIPCEHGVMMKDQCIQCGRAKLGSERVQ